MKFSWTQPQCDSCWEEQHAPLEPVRFVEGQRITERCVTCDEETRSGIYIRIDPTLAKFPSIVKEM